MERDEKRTREREAFASLDTQYTYSYGHTLDICGCGDMCAVQLVAPISFSPSNIFESNWKWIIFSRSFSLLSFYFVWLSFASGTTTMLRHRPQQRNMLSLTEGCDAENSVKSNHVLCCVRPPLWLPPATTIKGAIQMKSTLLALPHNLWINGISICARQTSDERRASSKPQTIGKTSSNRYTHRERKPEWNVILAHYENQF